MAGALPEALGELVDDMEARGFVVTTDEASDAFGNRLVELRREGSRARLVRDRGLWSVEVEVTGEFYDTYEVAQALHDARYTTRALSHEERRLYTLEALDRIPRQESERALIRQRLSDFRREYNQRLGVEVD